MKTEQEIRERIKSHERYMSGKKLYLVKPKTDYDSHILKEKKLFKSVEITPSELELIKMDVFDKMTHLLDVFDKMTHLLKGQNIAWERRKALFKKLEGLK